MSIPNAAVSELLKLTPQQLDEIKRSIESEAAPSWFAELSRELQSADYMLAQLMHEQVPPIWSPPNPPVQPPNYDPNAHIEFGPVLYSLEHRLPTRLLNDLPPSLRPIVKRFGGFWENCS